MYVRCKSCFTPTLQSVGFEVKLLCSSDASQPRYESHHKLGKLIKCFYSLSLKKNQTCVTPTASQLQRRFHECRLWSECLYKTGWFVEFIWDTARHLYEAALWGLTEGKYKKHRWDLNSQPSDCRNASLPPKLPRGYEVVWLTYKELNFVSLSVSVCFSVNSYKSLFLHRLMQLQSDRLPLSGSLCWSVPQVIQRGWTPTSIAEMRVRTPPENEWMFK